MSETAIDSSNLFEIQESTQHWLGDLALPNIFISNYLGILSPKAVKIYIYALYISRSKKVLEQASLLAHLGLEKQDLLEGLAELAKNNLIQLFEHRHKFSIVDLKEQEVHRRFLFEPKGASKDYEERFKRDKDKQHTIRQIGDSFFPGCFTRTWSNLAVFFLYEYGFDDVVVYQLFHKCYLDGKLNGDAYIKAVAKNWYLASVKTKADLAAYMKEWDRKAKYVAKVSRKLRFKFDEGQETMVRSWLDKFPEAEDVIFFALSKSVNKREPGLSYFDAILSKWHRKGLCSLSEVKAYEEKTLLELKKEGKCQKHRGARKGSSLGNFEQRQYTAEELKSSVLDLGQFIEEDREERKEEKLGQS